MTIDQMIAVMQAAKEGKEIEYRAYGDPRWLVGHPLWNWEEWEYRIKPEPPVCPIASSVSERVLSRAALGLKKYGVTVGDAKLSRKEWLRHAQEEALDLAVYLERLIATEAQQ